VNTVNDSKEAREQVTENTTTKPVNPYAEQQRKVTAAVEAWLSDTERSGDPKQEARALVDYLSDEDLTIVPQVASGESWRVIVDGEPAPHPVSGSPTGPLGADEAVDVFLRSALEADEAGRSVAITVRPVSDDELTGSVIGDKTLRPGPVTAGVEVWAQIQRGDLKVLRFVGGDHTVVEAEFDGDLWALFAEAMAEEAEGLG
jgi:hypothetical protein